MQASSSPLSVKSTNAAFQPTTTNESLILLFTQNQAILETLEALKEEFKDFKEEVREELKQIKDDQKKDYDRYKDLEQRVSTDERDKKILVGILAFAIPLLVYIALAVFFN